jgi:hypothetical protein
MVKGKPQNLWENFRGAQQSSLSRGGIPVEILAEPCDTVVKILAPDPTWRKTS